LFGVRADARDLEVRHAEGNATAGLDEAFFFGFFDRDFFLGLGEREVERSSGVWVHHFLATFFFFAVRGDELFDSDRLSSSRNRACQQHAADHRQQPDPSVRSHANLPIEPVNTLYPYGLRRCHKVAAPTAVLDEGPDCPSVGPGSSPTPPGVSDARKRP